MLSWKYYDNFQTCQPLNKYFVNDSVKTIEINNFDIGTSINE